MVNVATVCAFISMNMAKTRLKQRQYAQNWTECMFRKEGNVHFVCNPGAVNRTLK